MPSHYVWPYEFSLRVMGLVEAARQQRVPPVQQKFFPKGTGNSLPIALRWSHVKELGFPREPFQVFRRPRNTAAEDRIIVNVLTHPVPIGTQPVVSTFARGDATYVVNASVGVPSGTSVTLEAVDIRARPIPGQTVTISSNSVVQFRCPGIVAVHAFGSGTIGPFSVVPETAYANLPDWENIQTVGLPLLNGEIGAAYRTLPQGIHPAAVDGVAFAVERVLITSLLQVDPFPTGVPDFPLPAWPAPLAQAYVANMRAASSLVPMIERCLQKSVDTDPTRQQSGYVETVTVPGIKQSNVPGATANPAQTSRAALPIVGVAMLAASTDAYAAVALGYGTLDVPPRVEIGAPRAAAVPTVHPPVDAGLAYDYMVTAPFTLPTFTITLAALSAGQARVELPVNVQAVVRQTYPPLQRNHEAPASIQVSWTPPEVPQGYGILSSRAPNTSQVLNLARPVPVKGFDPFIALLPNPDDPSTPPDQQTPTFSDASVALPLDAPSTTQRYMVAGLDVFGTWSGWSPASASLSPLSITKPGMRDARFVMDAKSAVGHVVPATLRIEFAWDWQDRAPAEVRFTGQFVPAGSSLGPIPFLAGFAMSNTTSAGPPVALTFSYANQAEADNVAPSLKVPTIDAAHSTIGPVTVLPATSGNTSGSNQVVYRFELTGMSLDFTSVDEIDFALYVTATEQIRPGEFSDATDPVTQFIGKIVRALDPLPPVVTFVPPSISWTALPDATGSARGLLEWTPDPKAAGYYVWEATESALWQLLSPGTPEPPASTPLVTRGASLKALIDGNPDASLQGFARLNRDPIAAPRTEVTLPASAATLYAYRISAISANNVETPRSPHVAIFGVPRRNVPGVPRLLLRKPAAPQTGVQVIALPVECGAPPAGYRVFRVHNPSLSLQPSTMGPPKIDETNPNWQDFSTTTLAGSPLNGKATVDAAAGPSWYPYFYRITAVGVQDAADGQLSGESGYSGAQSQFCLPPEPPLVAAFAQTGTPQVALLSLLTDLPITPSPLGPALVEIIHMLADATRPGRLVAHTVLSSSPDQISVGVIAPPPRMARMARSTPDAAGRWTLHALFPYTGAEKNTFAVRLTDPLGRQSSRSF